MSVNSFLVIFIFHIGTRLVVHGNFDGQSGIVKIWQNETLLLPCYTEHQKAKVTWLRDNTLLGSGDDLEVVAQKRVKIWANKSLEISNVQPEDAGEYACRVSRPAPWAHVVQTRKVEVMYPPSVSPVPDTGELEVNMKEEVEMACRAKGVPTPTISWIKEDEEIPLISDRHRLRFHAENRSSAGKYFCKASNGLGKPAIATINLRIRYPPEIEAKNNWNHVFPGMYVQLKCKVTAWPAAKVDWYFKGEKIDQTQRTKSISEDGLHTLLLKDAMITDYGEYFCRASNSMGITEKMIELSGAPNPATFTKNPQRLSKNSFNFVWEVDSYNSIIDYKFYFRKYTKQSQENWHRLIVPNDDEETGPYHSRSFNLTGLADASIYEAFVRSRTRYGWSRDSKIIRFATEGAQLDVDAQYHSDPILGSKSVVRFASMSHSSQYNANGTGSVRASWSLLFASVLVKLCIIITRYFQV